MYGVELTGENGFLLIDLKKYEYFRSRANIPNGAILRFTLKALWRGKRHVRLKAHGIGDGDVLKALKQTSMGLSMDTLRMWADVAIL